MKIKFIWIPLPDRLKFMELRWYVQLDPDEMEFKEEIRQEMHLNIKGQWHGGEKLW